MVRLSSGVVAALLACVACAVLPFAAATHGTDVSSAVYPEHWKCLRSEGYTFTVIRGWQSNGVPDPNCPHTIYNAWAGGMSDVDVYLFPCFSCGNPGGQVRGLIDYLAKYNITNRSHYGPPHTFGMLWLDIEGPQYWGDRTANINFIQGLIDEAERSGVALGIYTSASQWGPIAGDWSGGSRYPLWYANYDGEQNYGDFSPFAGWSRPSIKQYKGTTDFCGASVDLDWYP